MALALASHSMSAERVQTTYPEYGNLCRANAAGLGSGGGSGNELGGGGSSMMGGYDGDRGRHGAR